MQLARAGRLRLSSPHLRCLSTARPLLTRFGWDPDNTTTPHTLRNFVNGEWRDTKSYLEIEDPLKAGDILIRMPNTQEDELSPFIDSLNSCPKSGLHNPFRNPDRYVMLGEVSHKAAILLEQETELFARAIQRVMPKSRGQAIAEVKVTVQFLKNFGGDNVRFMAQDFGVAGDHGGQHSRGMRFPYGAVGVIAPFNFPLEIPVLQLMGALFMGNKPVMKGADLVSVVVEMFLRLLHESGLPKTDVDLLHCRGPVAQSLIERSNIRMVQFTGSSTVAEKLAVATGGKVAIEDAGFDWKILGPEGPKDDQTLRYVAYQSDQDAYACTGQKCSAQSICFAHTKWLEGGFVEKIKHLASRRSLKDLTVASVMTLTTEAILGHVQKLLNIKGAKLLFGGKELAGHNIPKQYGAVEPTAVFVPLKEMMASQENFDLVTTEIFGPFQVITEYDDSNVQLVVDACERMSHHLTAAVVSNDINFQNRILGSTVNGTTYAGVRARTTGAPQNHWFGPAGDPRGAGIGSPGAIKHVWSCHREVIVDCENVPVDWEQPAQS